MSIQRVIGVAMTNQTAPIWNVIEEFKALRQEVEQADWPVELVLGESDGITETPPWLIDHKQANLHKLDYYISTLEDAEQFYLQVLKGLP
jgi:hypothetical protein